ncbi:MAG: oxygenase MpaB family protein [Cyanobacteria bacterium P01_G01_bin.54]
MQTTFEYFKFDEARQRYGDRVERYRQFLHQADPLADDAVAALAQLPAGQGTTLVQQALNDGIETVPQAPEALKDLFAQVEHLPWWVDWQRIDRGGQALRQRAIPMLLTLVSYALPIMYSSPAGTKPLAATKYLVERAARRLAETSAFVRLNSEPGGLQRFGEGFKTSLKVRLMHAQVRRLLLNSGRWQTEAWGLPINQAHMAGTALAISAVIVLKLQDLGFEFSPTEVDDILHLWRYSNYLSGVCDDLVCNNLSDARRFMELIVAIEGPPDEDCKALIQSLRGISLPLNGLEKQSWFNDMVGSSARVLLGSSLADALEVPKNNWRFVIPFLLDGLSEVYRLQLSLPGGNIIAEHLGVQVWEGAEGLLFSAARPHKS